MKIREYEYIMQKVLQLVEEGVHVLDREGNTIIYNDAMARLEKMQRKGVLRRPFKEVFKNISDEESTLLQALHHKKITLNKQQTYLNRDGMAINAINSTIPVIYNDEVIAAIEVSKDVTYIRQMSNTILDLHKEKLEPEHSKSHRIRKYSFNNLVGQNKRFLETVETARKAARSPASVLLYGETGTGKELIAQSIHFDSARRDKPFLAQNCAALPESLLEGILFGTAKGGFTGAIDREGLFEQADGGTLLLDEISAMPYELQGKLLRVLQEDYLRRVGGTEDIPIDVRIIATINERPEQLIQSGKLRKDLFYRLNIISIDLLPLREKKDDILLLAGKFIEKYNKRYGKKINALSEGAKEKLLHYDYPGNVRELENIIMAAISMADGEQVLTEKHILLNNEDKDVTKGAYDFSQAGMDWYLESMEKEMITFALAKYGRNISKAAEFLRIKRQTLQHKMKKYQL
ncbi:MAG TPA: sigma 54-interacting transcriptional regulator [Anaerovoracaceae bacterium]|nr:sigma 54-interacting transcriptional regulator [Anaerovoracaceae bacterium]